MMHTALRVPSVGFTEAYAEYLTQLIEDAGNPTDPVERMLLEQMALVHFRIADLHVKATMTDSIDGQKLLMGCAARLQGEFRKTALARQSIRSAAPTAKKSGDRLKLAATG